jgi:signal transduction histidine kinase/tetratricopeptide (TPR) repeat protein
MKQVVGYALLCLLTFSQLVDAQPSYVLDLKKRLSTLTQNANYKNDTAYLNTINSLCFYYADNYPDSAISLLQQNIQNCITAKYDLGLTGAYLNYGLAFSNKGDYKKADEYYEQALTLAEKNNFDKMLPKVLNNMGLSAMAVGNYSLALSYYYRSLETAEKVKDQFSLGRTYNNIAIVNFFQGKMEEAEVNYKKLLTIAKANNDIDGYILANNNIGEVYLERKQFATAIIYFTSALQTADSARKLRYLVSSNKNLGLVYLQMDSLQKASFYFKEAYKGAINVGNKPSTCVALIGLANTQLKQELLNDALTSGKDAVAMAEQMGSTQLQRDANEVLAKIYEAKGDGFQALNHYRLFKQYADSLRNIDSERTSERLKAEFDFSRKELQFERKSIQQRWLLFSVFAALLTAILIMFLVYRSRQKEKKANMVLQRKNNTIEHQKQIAEDTLHQLQSTQKQLIQAEKMASLGELTAGIAHEIQNPLNFVNNFSELNKELLVELKDELKKGNLDEVTAIAEDVISNEEKINSHGKRAADIVKGMLQHSRNGSGQQELTDINELCDEYLRLAYHGLRAKDNGFNASFTSSFDESIGKINVVSQDFGRVILNLINNAFYAVNDKKKKVSEDYNPTISITTKKTDKEVVIAVADNGSGIPQNIREKIFQPFFTTKPTGSGTGLGLSLSYDIIKAHNGELKVESTEGQGTTFIIHLPV